MKYYTLVVLVIACVYAAPTINGGVSARNGNVSVEMKTKGFKAFLYLFAPESWISSWNAIPAEGQNCFLTTASDPANAELYNSDDVDRIKQDLQTKCASSATQLGSFLDLTSQSVKSLPASFLQDSKAWGEQMQALGEQIKQASATAGNQADPSVFKQYIGQFAKSTADFTAKVAALSQTDRDQIAAAFPKIQPFISGDHSVEFLKEISGLYQTLGSGNVDASALQTQGQQLKTTLQAVWQQYQALNADGLKQASELLGKDLTQIGAAFNAQAGVQESSGNFKLGSFGEAHPELVSKINEKVADGKEKIAAGKEQIQTWLKNTGDKAKQEWQENGKPKLEQFKQESGAQWQQLKNNAQEIKDRFSNNQGVSVNGAASVDANQALANLKVQ